MDEEEKLNSLTNSLILSAYLRSIAFLRQSVSLNGTKELCINDFSSFFLSLQLKNVLHVSIAKSNTIPIDLTCEIYYTDICVST